MNLIFDFDGTICDSVTTSLDVINKVCAKIGYEKTSLEELRKVGVKGIIKSRNIPVFKIPKIVSEYRKEVEFINKNAIPYKGMGAVLDKLAKDYILGILTSNEKENAENFLQRHDLNYFDFIYSEKDIFGKDKKLKKIIKKYGFKKNETYYIGDETRDIEAAKKLDLKTIAVTWGFESEELLKRSNPDKVLNKPNDLLKIWK